MPVAGMAFCVAGIAFHIAGMFRVAGLEQPWFNPGPTLNRLWIDPGVAERGRPSTLEECWKLRAERNPHLVMIARLSNKIWHDRFRFCFLLHVARSLEEYIHIYICIYIYLDA